MGKMALNEYGTIVDAVWDDLPNHYPHVQLDASTIMPNHFHAIIILAHHDMDVGAGFKPAPTAKRHALPEIIRGLKTFSSRRINKIRNTTGEKLWQRGFYEHIIRNENELNRTRQYILDNPDKWHMDRENTGVIVQPDF